ncbi:hypothetical protein Avbf_16681 [Armadillidium vulgare]|nr:hypothetical protein Avbf_16681 [Armadillidium vulgare]
MFKLLCLILFLQNSLCHPILDHKVKRDLRSKLTYLPPLQGQIKNVRGQSSSHERISLPKISRALSLPDKEFGQLDDRFVKHDIHQNRVSDDFIDVPKPFDVLKDSVKDNSRSQEAEKPTNLHPSNIFQAPIVFTQRVTGFPGSKPVVFSEGAKHDLGRIKHVKPFEAPLQTLEEDHSFPSTGFGSSFSKKEFRPSERNDFSISKSELRQPSGLYELPVSKSELEQPSGGFQHSIFKSELEQPSGGFRPSVSRSELEQPSGGFQHSVFKSELEQPSGGFRPTISKSELEQPSGGFQHSIFKSELEQPSGGFRPSAFKNAVEPAKHFDFSVHQTNQKEFGLFDFSTSKSEEEQVSDFSSSFEKSEFRPSGSFEFSDSLSEPEQPSGLYHLPISKIETENLSNDFASLVTKSEDLSKPFDIHKTKHEQPSNLFEFSNSKNDFEQPAKGFDLSISKSELESPKHHDFLLSKVEQDLSSFKDVPIPIREPDQPSGLYELPQSPSELNPRFSESELPLESVSKPIVAVKENPEPLTASGNEIAEERIPSQPVKGMPYNFSFGVRDANSGNHFSQRAVSDGEVTEGEYSCRIDLDVGNPKTPFFSFSCSSQ